MASLSKQQHQELSRRLELAHSEISGTLELLRQAFGHDAGDIPADLATAFNTSYVAITEFRKRLDAILDRDLPDAPFHYREPKQASK